MNGNGRKIKISVIIPVYNVASYLKKCLDSIVAQTYEGFEVCLVNDGSTDSSGTICDRYSEADSRFRTFHQKNQGVSMARNMGLAIAKGEYIVFADSDDWIAPDYLQGLFDDISLQGVDMVDQSFERINSDGTRVRESYVNRKYVHENIIRWIETMVTGHTGPFPKIYKKKIIQDQGLRFDTSLKFCEDLVFTLEYMQYAKNGIYYSDKCRYYYRQVETSLGNSFYQNDMTITHQALVKIMDVINNRFYTDLGNHREELVHLRNKIIQISMFFIASLHNNSTRKDRIEALKMLKSYELDHYWRYITVRNPLRKAFHWLFEKNQIHLAVFIEDLTNRINKKLEI